MSVQGTFQAGFLVALIVLFCFSVRLGKKIERQERDSTPDEPWGVELRLMCQPDRSAR